jgi:hypothetical protein
MQHFDVTIGLAVNGRCQLTVPIDQAAAVKAVLDRENVDWRSEDGFSFGHGSDLRRYAVFLTSGPTGAELAGWFGKRVPSEVPEPATISMA